MRIMELHRKPANEWLTVVREMLEFVPAPALLADALQREIIAANSAALQASGFSEKNIGGMKICRLFPEISRWGQGVQFPKSVFTLIQPAGRPSHQVLWHASPLGKTSRHWLITFQSQAEPNASLHRPLPRKCFTGWQRLANAWSADSFSAAVRHLLHGMVNTLGAEWGAAYLTKGENLRLVGMDGSPPGLPPHLPKAALGAFAETTVHRPARIGGTPLHRAIHTSPTPYFISLPLKTNKAELWGVMAFGYYHLPPQQAVEFAEELTEIASKVTMHLGQKEECAKDKNRLSLTLSIQAALISQMEEGVLRFNAKLRLVEMNPAAEGMLGYQEEDALGLAIGDLLPANISIESEARVAMLTNHPREADAYLLRSDGNDFPARIRFVPYPLAQGTRPEGLLVLITDRSEAALYRAQSERLERRAMLGDVMASFAHEVRNPLNSISIGIQWLALNADEISPDRETLNSLQEDVERLNHLVKNLLNYTRARPLQFKPIDIAQLLRQILRRLKPRFHKYRIQTELRLPENLPKVNGDRLTLEQAFVNILDNAIKALAEQPEERFIAVRAMPVQASEGVKWVEVDIMDTGPGFSEEAKRRIFEPFFTTRKDGTGLGLAITKQIITAHRGNIEAESYPGGTIFRVKLRAAGEKDGI